MPPVATPLRTLIADDHPAITRLLEDFLANRPKFVVVGVVHTGLAVQEFCAKRPVDCLILDLGLPDMSGLEVLAALKAGFPGIRTLVFSSHITEQVIRSALDLGALGFLEKSATLEELSEALTKMIDGHAYMGPTIRAALVKMMRNRYTHVALTADELKVLRWLTQGVQNKEMADRLGMSISGTYKVIERVKTKLGVKTPADLVFAGIQYGISPAQEIPK